AWSSAALAASVSGEGSRSVAASAAGAAVSCAVARDQAGRNAAASRTAPAAPTEESLHDADSLRIIRILLSIRRRAPVLTPKAGAGVPRLTTAADSSRKISA